MTDKTGGDKLLYCSFCGNSQHEVRKLIAGPSEFICDERIELCNDIIRQYCVSDVRRSAPYSRRTRSIRMASALPGPFSNTHGSLTINSPWTGRTCQRKS